MEKFRRYAKFATIVYSIVVFYLLWKEKNPQYEPKWWIFTLPHFDKVIHCGIFTIWTILFYLFYSSFLRKTTALFILLFSLTWITELGQFLFTQTRSFDLLDIVADLVGITLGYLLIKLNVSSIQP